MAEKLYSSVDGVAVEISAQEADDRRVMLSTSAPPAPEPTIHIAWLRAALAEAGKMTAVDKAVAAQGTVQKQLWDYATTIRRNHPSVVAIAAALDLDLDALFARAAAIRGEQA